MKKFLFLLLIYFSKLFSYEVNIGFGSCFNQNYSFKIWDTLQKENLNYFIFMGDNVYSDLEKNYEIAYQKLFQDLNFKNFIKKTKILAIWDDHDYGKNDAGKEFEHKYLTKKIFLNYWYKEHNLNLFNQLFQQEGLYHSYIIQLKNYEILIILLDTRWFKVLKSNSNENETILGEVQWNWLEKQFQRQADLILLVSSIQILPEEHRFEKWYDIPNEKKKLIELIQKYNIEKLLILSGDRHFAEISKQKIILNNQKLSFLYEITSSSLNQELSKEYQKEILKEKNSYRIFGPFLKPNFGFFSIKFNQKKPEIKIGIKDENANEVYKIIF